MAESKVKTRIQNKHDFEINWLQATFPPLKGEIIVYDSEIDATGAILKTKIGGVDTAVVPVTLKDGTVLRSTAYNYSRFKIGDGITPVNDLPFVGFTPEERAKLLTIAEKADNVLFTGSLTSGTKIGTITINGEPTDIFVPAAQSYNTGTSTTSGLTKLYTSTGSNTDGAMPQSAVTSTLNNLISSGTADPSSATASQFYFKYSI